MLSERQKTNQKVRAVCRGVTLTVSKQGTQPSCQGMGWELGIEKKYAVNE